LATFPELLAAAAPFAARFVPAEAHAEAEDILRTLIGDSLVTAAGQINTILQVADGIATVATNRSPAGQPVPIKDVQAALDLLARDGRITIAPADAGYRSAFIGAVLRTLPGSRIAGSPPAITFDPVVDAPTIASPDAPFVGDLHKDVVGKARGEQGSLRRQLIGTAEVANCAICGHAYPARFLWASHIKKRAACTDVEARDLSHVAMLACLFGCDALFESGLIAVSPDGRILTSSHAPTTGPIAYRLKELQGAPVTAFTPESSSYFEWHRTSTFLST
jgi:hypothetical protein